MKNTVRADIIRPLLAVVLAFVSAFIFGCGEHSWEEILFGESSSSENANSGVSSSGGNQNYSFGEDGTSEQFYDNMEINQSSSSGADSTDNFNEVPDVGQPPPTDTTPTPPSISNSQGAVIVEPLLKTQWGSGSPFDPFNTLPDGSKGWVGCWLVADVQTLKYFNYPRQATGHEAYQGIVFDWANMPNSYKNVDLSEQQRKAITTLINSIYLSKSNDYVKNFGYDRSIQEHSRKYYDDSTFEAIVKKQLDSGLIVRVHGENGTGRAEAGTSHAFIIDGYDNKGKFHINWGWGGSKDGYYFLNALNPGERDYNSNNYININIRPDKGSIGSNEMALDSFTVGKTSVSQYELFKVRARIRSLGIFPGGQVGTALVGNNGEIVKVLGIKNFSELGKASLRTYSDDIFLSTDVNPKQYTLRIATRFEGGAWKLATLSDRTANIPSAINFTVKQPESGAPGGGYGLGLTKFITSKTTVLSNELFTVSSTLKNFVPTDTFPGGQVGMALINSSGNISSVLGIVSFGTLNPAASRSSTISGFVPDNLNPGQYKLRMVVRPTGGEWKVATMSLDTVPNAIDFTVGVRKETGGAPGGGYGLALETFAPSKTTVSQNELFAVESKLKNVSPTDTFPSGYLGAALVDGNGKIVKIVGTFRHTSTRAPGQAFVLKTIDSYVPVTVKPGQYKLRTVVRPVNNEEWRVATLAFDGVPTSFDFTVNPAKNGETSDGYGLALETFAPSKTSVAQNESFTVDSKLKNVSPTDTFPSGFLGAALVYDDGKFDVLCNFRHTATRAPGEAYVLKTITNCNVPNTVQPGRYKLRTVVRPVNNEEWRVATMAFDGVPTAIDFTVK